MSRRNLLSQAEAKYEEEMMLMNNSVASITDQRHEPSEPAPDDLAINMEASPGPLLPTLQEGSDTLEGSAAEGEAYVTVKSKLHSTQTATATQDFELEVSVQ